MKNFEQFVGIDWSGAKTPVQSHAIAVSLCLRGRGEPHLSGKRWSRAAVADWLGKLAEKGRRTLVGVDCNFGYAYEIGAQQLGPDYGFMDLWRAVDEACKGEHNYFAGPWWEASANQKYFWTGGTKPKGMVLPKRVTETICGEAGYGWPESPFKLHGPKQVGKGGLAGMCMVLDLKKRCGDLVAIWPFERALAEEKAVLVMTEIFPRQFLRRTGHGSAKLRNVNELNKCLVALNSDPTHLKELSDHEGDALVSAAGLRYLCGDGETIPETLSAPPAMTDRAAKCEGWIFGAGDNEYAA